MYYVPKFTATSNNVNNPVYVECRNNKHKNPRTVIYEYFYFVFIKGAVSGWQAMCAYYILDLFTFLVCLNMI